MTKSSKTHDSDSRRKSTKSGRTRNKSNATAKRKPQAVAAPAPATTSATTDQRTCDDEAAFVESLVASGQAARLDKEGKLPAGATHKIVEDDSGHVKVVRRRFSIT